MLEALSENRLKEKFPVRDWDKHRADCSCTEAFARTLAGVAPWIELGSNGSPEGELRERFGLMARKSLISATDPKSPDYLSFGNSLTVGRQALVEAAYLAQALLRAPKVLWEPLTEGEKQHVIASLKMSRRLKPIGEGSVKNNWLLFASMVEAAIWHYTGEVQKGRLNYGLGKFRRWYLGDGTYGDGPHFHWDYYNGWVIHPMLMDILKVCLGKNNRFSGMYDQVLLRAQRYAAVQERMISPEATFPVIGRSSAYRFAAFQALSQIILWDRLPETIKPGAARSGITALVRRVIEAPGTFDRDGWLEIGSVGYQPSIRDSYNSTGSLYICLTGLLHLGLPADSPFWLAPAADWTQKRIWSGQDIARDQALEEGPTITKRAKRLLKSIWRAFWREGGGKNAGTIDKATSLERMEGINMTLKVSIIINNFNYGRYLASCIESALAQTYGNIEVIVSDDGSTDDSQAVIESFGTSIIASFKSNGGQASALNAGFKKSSGNLVIFLDADDLLKPHCVAEIVRHWRADMMKLHFNLEVIDASGKAVGCLYMKRPLPRGDLREHLLTSGAVASMGMSGNVFARTFLEQVMPMPEVGWERGADTYLFNLAALTGQVGAIDEPLGGYRVHGNNVSAKVKKGNVNKLALRKFLQREILTDRSLNDYGRKIGVNYRLGTLTGALPHIQQLFLHEKLYREERCFGDISVRRLFVLYMKLLVTAKGQPFYKKPIIAAWSLVIALLPKAQAEWVVVSGYRHGLVFAATKVLSRPQAKVSLAGAVAAAGGLAICLAA